MKRYIIAVIVSLLLFALNSEGAVFSSASASLGPAESSDNYSGWQSNKLSALRYHLHEYGDPPVRYTVKEDSGVTVSSLIALQNGSSESLLRFSGSFEITDIRLSDVTFTLTSGDPNHIFNKTVSFAGVSYSKDLTGTKVGKDNILGTEDDVIVTAGSGNQKMDALYLTVDAFITASTEADYTSKMSYLMGNLPFNITGTFTLTKGTSVFETSATEVAIPEPRGYAYFFWFLLSSLAFWRKIRS